MENYKNDKICYLGGHILNEAMVDYRQKQHEEVEAIKGITPYSPHNDKSINDKANAIQQGLAERILKNDFKAMEQSDIYVFDVLNEGIGSISELSIVLGMKKQAHDTLTRLEELADIHYINADGNVTDEYRIIQDEIKEQERILNKSVLCYCSDIRQGHNKPYNDPDRAEFSTNQFVYGCILELTNGEGFISWEQVKDKLKKLGEEQ